MATREEELQAEVVRLSAENTQLKAEATINVVKAKTDERQRVVDILDANKTFGLSLESAIDFIKEDYTKDMAVKMMELVKKGIQTATAITTAGASDQSTLTESTIPTETKGFLADFDKAFAKVSDTQQLFSGVK